MRFASPSSRDARSADLVAKTVGTFLDISKTQIDN
jgi:hypothetical protein